MSVETADPVSGITALCAACSSAHSETVHFFLSRGAHIGATRPQLSHQPARTDEAVGNSPLICAVASGSWDLVVSLLTRGLDVNEERTVDGFTPLMAAAYNGHIGVMELLLSRGLFYFIDDNNLFYSNVDNNTKISNALCFCKSEEDI